MTGFGFLYDMDVNSYSTSHSLEQGKYIQKCKDEYEKPSTDSIRRLQETNVVESMDNRTHMRDDDVSEIEDKFNKNFSDYNTAHKGFVESSLNSNKPSESIKQYLGRTVTPEKDTYSYINDYGYTQKYSTDAWKNNHKSCPSTSVDIDQELYKTIKAGENMGNGQPCGFAGKNVQNKTTKEYAWVDIKGLKHVYSDDIWKNKIASCNTEALLLSASEYDAIATGSIMTEVDKCMKLEIDTVIWSDLMKKNSNLTDISVELISELKKDSSANLITTPVVDKDNSAYNIRIISWSLLFITLVIITADAIISENGGTMHMVGFALVALVFIIINFIHESSL